MIGKQGISKVSKFLCMSSATNSSKYVAIGSLAGSNHLTVSCIKNDKKQLPSISGGKHHQCEGIEFGNRRQRMYFHSSNPCGTDDLVRVSDSTQGSKVTLVLDINL